MFRVRDAERNERTYASREELTRAITSGEVGRGAEVFHTRRELWLPVEAHPAHPNYRASLEVQEPGSAEPKDEATLPQGSGEREAIQSRAGKLRAMLALMMGIAGISSALHRPEFRTASPGLAPASHVPDPGSGEASAPNHGG